MVLVILETNTIFLLKKSKHCDSANNIKHPDGGPIPFSLEGSRAPGATA